MTEEERDSLFKQMYDLNEFNKSRILTKVFAGFEVAQDEGLPYETECFFEIVQEIVDVEAESNESINKNV